VPSTGFRQTINGRQDHIVSRARPHACRAAPLTHAVRRRPVLEKRILNGSVSSPLGTGTVWRGASSLVPFSLPALSLLSNSPYHSISLHSPFPRLPIPFSLFFSYSFSPCPFPSLSSPSFSIPPPFPDPLFLLYPLLSILLLSCPSPIPSHPSLIPSSSFLLFQLRGLGECCKLPIPKRSREKPCHQRHSSEF